jgi:hypothetical protein
MFLFITIRNKYLYIIKSYKHNLKKIKILIIMLKIIIKMMAKKNINKCQTFSLQEVHSKYKIIKVKRIILSKLYYKYHNLEILLRNKVNN